MTFLHIGERRLKKLTRLHETIVHQVISYANNAIDESNLISRIKRAQREFVITRYRSTNSNLRTHLGRICKVAGVDMWIKPFQNMRSSAEIDFNKDFSQHTVASWLGHSESIATKHYLGITDDDFRRAAGIVLSEDEPDQKAKQNAKQHNAESGGAEYSVQKETQAMPGLFPLDAARCLSIPNHEVPPQGLEP